MKSKISGNSIVIKYVGGLGVDYACQISKKKISLFFIFIALYSKMVGLRIFYLHFLGVLHIVHASSRQCSYLKWYHSVINGNRDFACFPSLLGINTKHVRVSVSNTEIRRKTHLFIFNFDIQLVGKYSKG